MTTNFDLNVCICSEEFSAEELEEIALFAEKKAQEIVRHREERARIKKVEELNEKLFALINEAKEHKIPFSDGIVRGEYVCVSEPSRPRFLSVKSVGYRTI